MHVPVLMRMFFFVVLVRACVYVYVYGSLHGYALPNAKRVDHEQLDQLVNQKREEQKFNSMVEKQLKLEQARFAQVLEAKGCT